MRTASFRADAPRALGVRLSHALLALGATLALCRPAAAQRSAASISRVSVGLGGDARGAARGDGFGRSLLVGYDVARRLGGLPVTTRLTGTYLDRAGPGGDARFAGAGLDLSLPIVAGGPVRPYLLAGTGVYRLRDGAEGGPVRDRTTAAVVGGLGVRVPVGHASLFAEGRYTAFGGGGPTSYVPVVVGLRF